MVTTFWKGGYWRSRNVKFKWSWKKNYYSLSARAMAIKFDNIITKRYRLSSRKVVKRWLLEDYCRSSNFGESIWLFFKETALVAKLRQQKDRNSRSLMFFKTGSLKNFVILTEKHLCWSPFFNKIAGLGLQLY